MEVSVFPCIFCALSIQKHSDKKIPANLNGLQGFSYCDWDCWQASRL